MEFSDRLRNSDRYEVKQDKRNIIDEQRRRFYIWRLRLLKTKIKEYNELNQEWEELERRWMRDIWEEIRIRKDRLEIELKMIGIEYEVTDKITLSEISKEVYWDGRYRGLLEKLWYKRLLEDGYKKIILPRKEDIEELYKLYNIKEQAKENQGEVESIEELMKKMDRIEDVWSRMKIISYTSQIIMWLIEDKIWIYTATWWYKEDISKLKEVEKEWIINMYEITKKLGEAKRRLKEMLLTRRLDKLDKIEGDVKELMQRLTKEDISDKIEVEKIFYSRLTQISYKEKILDFKDILDYLNVLSRKKRLKTKDVERYVEEIRKTKLKEVIWSKVVSGMKMIVWKEMMSKLETANLPKQQKMVIDTLLELILLNKVLWEDNEIILSYLTYKWLPERYLNQLKEKIKDLKKEYKDLKEKENLKEKYEELRKYLRNRVWKDIWSYSEMVKDYINQEEKKYMIKMLYEYLKDIGYIQNTTLKEIYKDLIWGWIMDIDDEEANKWKYIWKITVEQLIFVAIWWMLAEMWGEWMIARAMYILERMEKGIRGMTLIRWLTTGAIFAGIYEWEMTIWTWECQYTMENITKDILVVTALKIIGRIKLFIWEKKIPLTNKIVKQVIEDIKSMRWWKQLIMMSDVWVDIGTMLWIESGIKMVYDKRIKRTEEEIAHLIAMVVWLKITMGWIWRRMDIYVYKDERWRTITEIKIGWEKDRQIKLDNNVIIRIEWRRAKDTWEETLWRERLRVRLQDIMIRSKKGGEIILREGFKRLLEDVKEGKIKDNKELDRRIREEIRKGLKAYIMSIRDGIDIEIYKEMRGILEKVEWDIMKQEEKLYRQFKEWLEKALEWKMDRSLLKEMWDPEVMGEVFEEVVETIKSNSNLYEQYKLYILYKKAEDKFYINLK